MTTPFSIVIPFRGGTRVSNLMLGFEEAANKNADQLGFGVRDLKRQGRTWMLHALTIQLDSTLREEPFTIRTWPSGSEKMFVYRDFEILQHHEIVGRASSSWLVVDVRERKMVIDRDFNRSLQIHEHSPASGRPSRFTIDEHDLYHGHENLITEELLDQNKHLNNKHFVDFALEGLSDKGQLKSLEIQFKSEAREHEVLATKVFRAGKNQYHHKIVSKNDLRLVAIARSSWR